jgi:uncharacterized phiE125 gp8 family phage protein
MGMQGVFGMIKNVLKTAPTKKPITIDGDHSIKDHIVIDQDIVIDDDYLERVIDAALDYVEQLTGRKLITQTWYHYLDDWPKGDVIIMPFGKLQSVTSIKYYDTDNTETVWSNSEYIVDTDSDPGRIVLAWGYSWPSTVLYPSNPIKIEFVCGYGDEPNDVNPGIMQAMKLIAADMYNNREITVFGISIKKDKFYLNLLEQHRIQEL